MACQVAPRLDVQQSGIEKSATNRVSLGIAVFAQQPPAGRQITRRFCNDPGDRRKAFVLLHQRLPRLETQIAFVEVGSSSAR